MRGSAGGSAWAAADGACHHPVRWPVAASPAAVLARSAAEVTTGLDRRPRGTGAKSDRGRGQAREHSRPLSTGPGPHPRAGPQGSVRGHRVPGAPRVYTHVLLWSGAQASSANSGTTPPYAAPGCAEGARTYLHALKRSYPAVCVFPSHREAPDRSARTSPETRQESSRSFYNRPPACGQCRCASPPPSVPGPHWTHQAGDTPQDLSCVLSVCHLACGDAGLAVRHAHESRGTS